MEKEIKSLRKSYKSSTILWGLVIVFIGMLFLGFNFGWLPMPLKSVVFSWPMILIFIGVIQLFFKRHHILSGLVLLIVGGFFITPKVINAYPEIFGTLDGNFLQMYWPVLLVFAGLLIIFYQIFKPKRKSKHCWNNYSELNYAKTKEYNSENFNVSNVFGNGEYVILDDEFKGGELNSVFGNIVLDLRKTKLPQGDTRLELSCVFGGITIYAPETWNIEKRTDSVFAGFEDRRPKNVSLDTTSKLIINGSFVFGGGEIKS